MTKRYRQDLGHGKVPIDGKTARANCSVIAGEILKDGAFFAKLAGWLAVNICYWLWEGEPLSCVDDDAVAALAGVYAESAVEALINALAPPSRAGARIAEILGASKDRIHGEIPPGTLLTLAGNQFQALREALYKKGFRKIEGSPWPTAPFGEGTTAWVAQLRPPALDSLPWLPEDYLHRQADRMWKQQQELSDRDADLLDALCSLYLAQAKSPNDAAIVDIDQLLELRGLKRKRGGGGRRGGFESEQRQDLLRSLSHIQNLWIDVAEWTLLDPSQSSAPASADAGRRLQSRPFVITDRMGKQGLDGSLDVERIVFRPGKAFAALLFGDGRQTGLLFGKALHYDPYRKRWEKRLTRYFCWRWWAGQDNPKATSGENVGTVLSAIGEVLDGRYPAKTRARLTVALDRLLADKVIGAWRYGDEPLAPAGSRAWRARWLATPLFVEPPDSLTGYYQRIKDSKTGDGKQDLGAKLRSQRRKLKLSQAVLCRLLGIGQSHLCKIEQGQLQPGEALRNRIEVWLQAKL
ncbi:MAG TPA: helix-turn-helix domain-containing protein [Rhodospirillaceae bacterium]|nr:helix-turn-helix domain-containing protein [Rhodospirillaceae bacterium]